MPEKSGKFYMIRFRNRQLIIAIFGTCLSLFGTIFGLFWPRIFDVILEKKLVLHTNSPVYELWQSPPMKTILDIYLFNWTNPEDFNNPSVKPILQELGPYRFQEEQEKIGVIWHENNASISFRKRSRYYFDAEGSQGSLSDKIITINSLAVTGAAQAKRLSPMSRTLVDLAMMTYPRDLTLRKTADEMLFDGFDDMLLEMAYMLPPSLSEIVVPFDKYGYFYGRNSSSQFLGNFNIYTGADDISKMGRMNTWNFKKTTKSYPTSCAAVQGSIGEFQGPHMRENDTVKIFLPEICRDLMLDYDGVVDLDGIKAYKYIGGKRAVDNGTLNEENKCYCNGECVPSGAINVTSCWYNSPIFVSYPHFYNADPYYIDQIEGMNPQKEKHQFEYIIEPKTGIGLHIIGRTQVNQLVEAMPHSRMFRDVRKIFFPLFWLESNTRLGPESLNYFKSLPTYVLCGRIFGGFCCFVGLILVFWYPIVRHFSKRLTVELENTDFENIKEQVKAKESIISRDIEMYMAKEKVRAKNSSSS